MELKFKVSGRIARPVHDVFEAVADPDELSSYFTTNGAKGRLETGATVIWDFADFPARSRYTSSRSNGIVGSSSSGKPLTTAVNHTRRP